MFVITRDVSAAMRVIATLLAIAVTMWTLGLYSVAEAANITEVSDLMTDTSPGADSDHTISFITPTGMSIAEEVVITFPAGFDLTGVTTADFAATAPDTNWTEAINTGARTITLTRTVSPVAPGATITVVVDGTNKISNPPTPLGGNESFEIEISAGADSGSTRVVILNTVLVTAQILTVFDFTVFGKGSGTTVNGTTTTGASSSTTLPFGILTAGEIETLAHDLTVATNAKNGFVVTVQSDGYFDSSTGAIIDDFADGAPTDIPAGWADPSENVNDPLTWGHWGVTSEDTVTGRTNEFGSNQWIGVTTTPRVIFAHTGPADEFTPGIGSTTVGYQVEITPLQEAGDDYSTILTYIATPTF